ncbi:MAG TPA: tetratricopeptide repeat protein, partial [Nitrospirota bacterium]|nr:tetratricopeptide repeat protein [Nitrospirota bacterium]
NREAVRLAPKRTDLLRNLGFTLHWAGKTAEALEVFKQAVAIDPADAESKKMIEQLSKRQ